MVNSPQKISLPQTEQSSVAGINTTENRWKEEISNFCQAEEQ